MTVTRAATPGLIPAALMGALHETYVEHIGVTESEGPEGAYVWCACGWRSDSLGPNSDPGGSYAVHLTNALHAAAVTALQPLVVRRTIGTDFSESPTEPGR